jgi:NADPH-dependent 2,4-dienoyl-CoA reductase/sulfur reductase-like enzyme
MLEGLAQDTDFITRGDILSRMREARIKVLAGRKAEKISGGELFLKDSAGKGERIRGDIIVLAMGSVPVRYLKKSLMGKVKEIHAIGDARQPGRIIDAVLDGFSITGG